MNDGLRYRFPYDLHIILYAAFGRALAYLRRRMKIAGKSKFDLAIIDLVKAMRVKKNLSQDDLAFFLDVTRGYIGHIESPSTRAKYNPNQLNRLAFEMKCSPREFIPDKATDEKISSGRKKEVRKKKRK